MTTVADLPAPRRRRLRRPAAALATADRVAGAGRRPGRGRPGRDRPDRVRHRRRHPVRPEHALDLGLRRRRAHPLPRRHERPLAVHGAALGRRHRRGDRSGDGGRAGALARLPGAAAPARVGARPALHRPGARPLLCRVGGHDDPALRAHGRVGRREPAPGDAPVRRLHHGGVAAHAGGDRRARRLGAHLRALRAHAPPARVDLALPRLRGRLLHQGAAVPAARLAAERLPRVDARGDGAPLRRDLQGRRVRPDRVRRPALPVGRPRLALGVPRSRPGRPPVRRRSSPSASRTRAASSLTPASAR